MLRYKKIFYILFFFVSTCNLFASKKTCEACGKEVFNLKIHMRTHTGERPYICQECNKGFTTNGNLERHKRIHTKKKTYVCHVCNDGFTTNDALVKHMRMHEKERAYVCQECQKRFKQLGHLTVHMRIHTKEKPYVCQECNKGFTISSNLKIHIRRMHTKERPHEYQINTNTFTTNGSLKKHLYRHTQKKALEKTLEIQDKEEVPNEENDFLLDTGFYNENLPCLPSLDTLEETSSDESEKIWESLKKYMIHEPKN